MKYRVQVELIRRVKVEVDMANSAGWPEIMAAARQQAIEEYGEHDDYLIDYAEQQP